MRPASKRVEVANLPHIVLSQLGCLVALALTRREPPLARGVGHVVEAISDEQMLGSHARWVIATVTDVHSLRDIDTGQRQRDVGGLPRATVEPEVPVTTTRRSTDPVPAAVIVVRLLDFGPEPFR